MGTGTFDRLGDVVLALGSPRFSDEYFGLFRSTLGVEVCTVFSFGPHDGPTPLIVGGSSAARRDQAWDLAQEYASGGFRHDPIIGGNLGATTPVVYRLFSNQLPDNGYRRRFYDEPALQGKVGVLGRIGGTAYYANFYRDRADRPFRQAEMARLRRFAGFAVKVLHRHRLATLHVPGPTRCGDDWRRGTLGHLRQVFLAERYRLTLREAEVCAHIVLGYSAVAIGLNLGISVNTVTTHRKRAYAKLSVCSQNELFERYFTTVVTRPAEDANATCLGA